jgi:hypothetical protein
VFELLFTDILETGEVHTGFWLGVGAAGKRPLVRPRHRWEDNIKMDIQVGGWGGVYWIAVA